MSQVRAAATSAVREARNGDVFLDRIRRRTGIEFDIINEAEEGRLLFLAVRDTLETHAAFRGARTLLAEVGGGSTSLTLLRRGEPTHSGVYALGSIRIRQQLDLQRHSRDVQMTLLRRYISNLIEEIRVEVPLNRVSHLIGVGGDVRFAAAQILENENEAGPREIAREQFLAFCDEVARLEEDELVERFRLPPSRRRRSPPRSSCIARWSQKQRPAASSSPMPRFGPACCSTSPISAAARAPRSSAVRCWPARNRSASAIGSIAITASTSRMLAVRLFDELVDEHGLGERQRLLLQVAGAAPRRRDLRQPALAPQALAIHPRRVANLRPLRRGNRDRRQHRPLSSRRAAAEDAPALRRAGPARIASPWTSSRPSCASPTRSTPSTCRRSADSAGATRHDLDDAARRDRRHDDGAAGGDGAVRHVRGDLRTAAGDRRRED